MHTKIMLHFLFSLLFISLSSFSVAGEPRDLIRSSCLHASFPSLCVRTLSTYDGPAPTTPRTLAQAAVRVSLAHARRVSIYLSGLGLKGKTSRERVALTDCVDQISESVDELSKTLGQLKHLDSGGGGGAGGESFEWQVSNAETWVSAALTYEDTCVDGFEGVDGKTKGDVKEKITNVARVTSNALYMINRLDDSSRGKPHH